MLAVVVQPAPAGNHDKLIQGLLSAGMQAMQNATEEQPAAEQPAETAPATSPAATPAASAAAPQSQDLIGAVLSSVQEQGRGYIKDLERQGKKYAQELGKTVVREIKRDPEVEQALTSVRVLCWGVLIYITLISILIFVMLWRMSRLLDKIVKAGNHS